MSEFDTELLRRFVDPAELKLAVAEVGTLYLKEREALDHAALTLSANELGSIVCRLKLMIDAHRKLYDRAVGHLQATVAADFSLAEALHNLDVPVEGEGTPTPQP